MLRDEGADATPRLNIQAGVLTGHAEGEAACREQGETGLRSVATMMRSRPAAALPTNSIWCGPSDDPWIAYAIIQTDPVDATSRTRNVEFALTHMPGGRTVFGDIAEDSAPRLLVAAHALLIPVTIDPDIQHEPLMEWSPRSGESAICNGRER